MIEAPPIISDYVSNGGGYVYALDIEPFAADPWPIKRYSTSAVTIGGDDYADALAQNITRIVYQARIIQQGATGTLPDLTVRLLNRGRLHEDFLVDNIVSRRATLRMTAISGNRCPNSSFESATGTDPHNWTMHPGGGSSLCGQSNAQAWDGANSCLVYGDTSESWIECDTIPRGLRIGERLHVSGYFGHAATDGTVGIALKLRFGSGSWLYYDVAAGSLGAARVINTVGIASSSSWQRFGLYFDWKTWHDLFPADTSEYADVVVEMWSAAGGSGGFYADAVGVEAWPGNDPTAYRHNRHELTADDCITVYSGVIKRPKWQHRYFELQLGAFGTKAHKPIPIDIVEQANDWEIPRSVADKPYPLTYGSFLSPGRLWPQPYIDFYGRIGQKMPARGVMVNLDTVLPDGAEVYFDSGRVPLWTNVGIGVYLVHLLHWNDVSNQYHEVMEYDHPSYAYDDTEWITDLVANARFKQSANPQFLPSRKMGVMVALRGKRVVGESYFYIAPDYGVDADWYSRAATSRTGAGGPFLMANIQEHGYNAMDIMTDSILGELKNWCIFLVGGFDVEVITPSGSSLDVKTRLSAFRTSGYYDSNQNGSYLTRYVMQNVTSTQTWNNYNISAWAPINQNLTAVCLSSRKSANELPPDLTIRIYLDVKSITSLSFAIYEFGALIYIVQELDGFNPAAFLVGRIFNDTWGGRRTALNAVEHPVDIIEAILRQELGVTTADINTARFDVARTDKGLSTAAAGQVLESENSAKVIERICEQFGLLYYIDEYGTHSMRTMKYRATPDLHLRQSDFIDPLNDVQVSETPCDAVVNHVRVLYDLNRHTDEYARVAYVHRNGSSNAAILGPYVTKCLDSYDSMGGVEAVMEVEADWINAKLEAESLVKWLVDWNSRQRLIVEGKIKMKYAGLELGDTVSLDMEPLLPGSITALSRFIVIQKMIEREKGAIGIQLLELTP